VAESAKPQAFEAVRDSILLSSFSRGDFRPEGEKQNSLGLRGLSHQPPQFLAVTMHYSHPRWRGVNLGMDRTLEHARVHFVARDGREIEDRERINALPCRCAGEEAA
jgi:hypothetical protein